MPNLFENCCSTIKLYFSPKAKWAYSHGAWQLLIKCEQLLLEWGRVFFPLFATIETNWLLHLSVQPATLLQCLLLNFDELLMHLDLLWSKPWHRSNGRELPPLFIIAPQGMDFFSWPSVRTQRRLLTHTPHPQILELFVKTRPWLSVFTSIRLSFPCV